MLKEFRQFILRGNVVDLAVAVVIGAAFKGIVDSLIANMIMPPLGLAIGRVNFTNLSVKIATGKDGNPILLTYGSFLQSVLNFLIVAVAIFALVKMMNTFQNLAKKKEEAAAPTTKACPQCMMDIPVAAKKCGHCTSVLG